MKTLDYNFSRKLEKKVYPMYHDFLKITNTREYMSTPLTEEPFTQPNSIESFFWTRTLEIHRVVGWAMIRVFDLKTIK